MGKLKKIEITICDDCLAGDGDECHTPGCALFLNRTPDHPIMPELYNIIKEYPDEELPVTEKENGVVQSGFRLGSTVKFAGLQPKRVRKKYPISKESRPFPHGMVSWVNSRENWQQQKE